MRLCVRRFPTILGFWVEFRFALPDGSPWLDSVFWSVVDLLIYQTEGCSSIGRALVSKTSGCGFKSLRPCHLSLKDTVSVDFMDGFLGCCLKGL